MINESFLVGDYIGNRQEKEEWRMRSFHPSFVKLTDDNLSSLSENQRNSTAKEFIHDGASFFQRGYIHYGLQLLREAIRIYPAVDLADCGFNNETILAILKIFKDESRRIQIGQGAASDTLLQWISNVPKARLYMTHSKYAQNARCVYCGTPNILKAWPPNGDEVPFYYCDLEDSHHRPGGYLIDVSCNKCKKVWCVVWDDDPIWGPMYSREALDFYNKGKSSSDSGRLEEALSNYSHALKLAPKMVWAYTNRGNIYRDLGHYTEAMADYAYALEIDPHDAIVYLNMGVMLGNEGELEKALPYFEKAAELGDEKGAAYTAKVKELLKK